jgi:hypothetical protein
MCPTSIQRSGRTAAPLLRLRRGQDTGRVGVGQLHVDPAGWIFAEVSNPFDRLLSGSEVWPPHGGTGQRRVASPTAGYHPTQSIVPGPLQLLRGQSVREASSPCVAPFCLLDWISTSHVRPMPVQAEHKHSRDRGS